jgi:DNA polymerase-3 subunit alpha
LSEGGSLGEGESSAIAPGKIRFGLAGIKGVGEGAAQKIIGEREAGGPYRDFDDFIHRVDGRAVNRRVLECLIKTGVFAYSGAARGVLFAGLDEAVEFISARLSATAADEREKTAGQVFLFGEAETPAVRRRNGAAGESLQGGGNGRTSDFPLSEQLQYEKELLGFYISGHPMNAYAGLAEAINTVPEDQLLDQPYQSEFRLCGIATGITKKLSRRDNRPWAAFTLATKRVSLPMNMFSDAYEEYAKYLVAETPVLVQGNLLAGNDGVRINVRECYPLDLIVPTLVKKITWLLRPDHPELPAFLRALRATVDASYGDTRLEFAFVLADRIAPFAEASAGLGWKLTVAQFQQLRAHPAVAGTLVETKRLQLKENRRWAKRG